MNAEEVLNVADRGPVRPLTLNRPDRFNALDEALLDRLPEELERAAADLRIAVASARFTPGFGAVALCGDYGGSYVLPSLVGREQALRLYLLGETWDAPTAERRGLVGQVVPDEELDSAVATLADRLASQAPLAVARMNHHFNTAERATFDDMLHLEAEGMIALAGTADFKERLAAFTDRRPPHFEGR